MSIGAGISIYALSELVCMRFQRQCPESRRRKGYTLQLVAYTCSGMIEDLLAFILGY